MPEKTENKLTNEITSYENGNEIPERGTNKGETLETVGNRHPEVEGTSEMVKTECLEV